MGFPLFLQVYCLLSLPYLLRRIRDLSCSLGFACVRLSPSGSFPTCWFLFSVSGPSRLTYTCSMNVKVCSSGTRPSPFPSSPPQHVPNMLRISQEDCYKNNSTGITSDPPTPLGLPVQHLCIVVNRMVILPPSMVLGKMVPLSDVRLLSQSWGFFSPPTVSPVHLFSNFSLEDDLCVLLPCGG